MIHLAYKLMGEKTEMAKRTLTEEQKQVLRDRLARARAAKASQNKNFQVPKIEQPVIINKETIAEEVTVSDLQRQIEELKSGQFAQILEALRSGDQQGAASVAGGKLTGTFEKYVLSPDRYPDPSVRLSEELRLQRFAFPMNYELKYDVGVSEYTTLDGIRTKEPKFSLELIRIIMDEDTGEPTKGRYIICRMIMHEDPEAALVVAREQGIVVDTGRNEADFLNEMRYIRMRDWLLECFYPGAKSKISNKREMVINGKLVTYYEVNDEQSQGIDFNKLPRVKF